MHIESVRRSALAAVVAASMAACNGSTPVAPPPPVVSNTPPTIESLVLAGPRAEAGLPIQVTATVSDAETPLGQLTYIWSALPGNGTFTSSGPTAVWHPPAGRTTPDVYTITLTVAETFSSGGQARQNVVSRSSAPVPYNDSPAEMTAIARQFIRDFGTFDVGPDECVRNFSDTCRGKEEERDQIARNRVDFTIQSAAFSTTPTTFINADLTGGIVEGPCIFIDVPNFGPDAGKRQSVSGTCRLTTIYQNFRWYLCESLFLGPHETVFLNLRSRVPGRILFR